MHSRILEGLAGEGAHGVPRKKEWVKYGMITCKLRNMKEERWVSVASSGAASAVQVYH